MARVRVGVLRGGETPLYNLSLKTGSAVLSALSPEKYEVRDILIDKSGKWHMRGLPVHPARALQNLDVVWNGLHGGDGENGVMQRLFTSMSVPFTGPDAVSGAVSLNKHLTKELARKYGLETPQSVLLRDRREASKAFDLFRSFPQPSVVKPVGSGSSLGVVVACSYQEFVRAIEEAFVHSDHVLIEEFIPGIEVSCATIAHFRGDDVYSLPAAEIRLPRGAHYTHELKMSDGVAVSAPSSFSRDIKRAIHDAAQHVHQVLGFKSYAQSDFIVGRGKVYFIEANALPDLAPGSRMAAALEAVGAPLGHVADHLLTLAINRK
jgi:D-alanine-D-alanine ligase